MNTASCEIRLPMAAKCWSLIFPALLITCIYAASSGNVDYVEHTTNSRPSTKLLPPLSTITPTPAAATDRKKSSALGAAGTAFSVNVPLVTHIDNSTSPFTLETASPTLKNVSQQASSTLPEMKANATVPVTTSVSPTSSPRPFVSAAPRNFTCYDIVYPIEDDPTGKTIHFRRSSPGIASQAPCPNNRRKLAIWRCTSMGWSSEPGQPDLTDCVDETLEAELDLLIKSLNTSQPGSRGMPLQNSSVANAVEKFENITKSSDRRRSFVAGDLLKVSSTASKLASAIPNLNRADVSTSKTAASMIRSNSDLLANDTRQAWTGLTRKDRGSVLGGIFENNEMLSFATLPTRQSRSLFNLAGASDDESATTAEPTNLQINKTVITDNFGVTLIPIERNSRFAFVEKVRTEESQLSIAVDFSATLMQRVRSKRTLSLASIVSYNSVASEVERLKIGGVDSENKLFNSPIFSISFADENGYYLKNLLLPEYFTFAVEHKYPNSDEYETSCVYYDVGYSLWLERGCERVSINATHTVCRCDHLTTFAILIDFTGRSSRRVDSPGSNSSANVTQTVAERAMFNISIIGCALSIAALFIFVLIVLFISRQNVTLRVIYSNFGLCLLIAEIVFLAGADKVNTNGCVPVAVLLQFFFTSTFLWSAALAFYFILVIYGAEPLTSREQNSRWPYFFFGCYFVAAMLIGATWITSTASGEIAYGNENYCWMNLPYTWFFISPIAFILVFNFGVLSAITFKTCSSRLSTTYVAQGGGDSTLKIVCRAMVGIIWTMLILCATWVLGFLYVSTNSEVVQFIFIILNSFQGVLVLVFYIVTNKQLRLDFAMFCRRKTWLPLSIRDWASYKVSSSSQNNNSNGSSRAYQTSARKSNLSRDGPQYSRELSSFNDGQ